MKTIFRLTLSLALALWGSIATASEADKLHPAVAAALAWEMPSHECGDEPKLFASNKATNDEQGLNLTVTDVDHYTQKRHARKVKRWEKCVDKHKKQLKKSFETLKNSAQHGLTQDQAATILDKMKLIQWALIARDAVPRDPEAAPS
ncbi:MAG: hypothetical protein RJQ07_14615 [Pseudomonadales bacterium]